MPPDLPTVAEAGLPGFESNAWNAIVAPAKTPRPIIDRLNRELVAIIHSEDVRENMRRIYFQAVGSSPAALAETMRSERALGQGDPTDRGERGLAPVDQTIVNFIFVNLARMLD